MICGFLLPKVAQLEFTISRSTGFQTRTNLDDDDDKTATALPDRQIVTKLAELSRHYNFYLCGAAEMPGLSLSLAGLG